MDILQNIAAPQSTAGNNSKPIFRAVPSPGAALPYWEQWVCVSPTKTLQQHSKCAVPQGLSHPYPEVKAPQRIFFSPGFSYSQSANGTKSRMQAQSSASAMLWVHTAYTGATPGILTPIPKAAKGMREKLVAWKKKEQYLKLFSGTAEMTFICSRLHETFPS